MAGRKIVYCDANAENGFLPLPDENVQADLIYICSPNNPTGCILDAASLDAVARVADQAGIYVICGVIIAVMAGFGVCFAVRRKIRNIY